jgi:hypothetical protein
VKDLASQNEELAAMLNDFQAKQFEMQAKVVLGEQLSSELMEQIQSLSQIIMRDPLALSIYKLCKDFSCLSTTFIPYLEK